MAGKPSHRDAYIRQNHAPVEVRVIVDMHAEALRQRQGITLATPLPPAGSTSSSPAVTNLLKLLPQPNGTVTVTSNGVPTQVPAFLGSASTPVNQDVGTADVSVNLTRNDQLHGYYAIEVGHRFEPQAGPATVPGWGDTRDARRQLFTLNETHTFGSSLTNDVRLGFNRLHITFLPNGQFDPATEGIGLPPRVPANSGLPLINIGNSLFFGSPQGDEGRGDTTVVFSDTMSWLKGRHSVQFGGKSGAFIATTFSRTLAALPSQASIAFWPTRRSNTTRYRVTQTTRFLSQPGGCSFRIVIR